LTLHIDEMREVSEPTPLGAIKVMRAHRSGKTVTINGCAKPFGEPNDAITAGGYALTHGVDADFWAEWIKTHADYAPVVNGSLFAVPKPEEARNEAKRNAKVRSGLEPLDPEAIPAEFTAGKARIAAA
jgi:hypothetical protein